MRLAVCSFYITLSSEGESDAASDRAISLGKKERAAIRRDERTIALREQVAHVHYSLRTTGKDTTNADRLAQQNAQISVARR